jgi:hypothetical protein
MLIYPKNERNYEGCISITKNNKFSVRIRKRNISKVLNTYDDAFDYLKNTNIINNFEIKNKILKYENYSEVELSKNKKMLIDNEDIEKIQSVLCYCDERYNTCYARYREKGTRTALYVHNYIMKYTPEKYNKRDDITIDHINNNGLDNRKINLRKANQSLQIRNQNTKKKSNISIKNIRLNKNNTYSVHFSYNKKRYRKIFKLLKDAKTWLKIKKDEVIPKNEI